MVGTGPRDEAVGADQQLLARSLGALIGVPRFDSPIHLARAVHGATLALSMYADNLPASDGDRLKVKGGITRSSSDSAAKGRQKSIRFGESRPRTPRDGRAGH